MGNAIIPLITMVDITFDSIPQSQKISILLADDHPLIRQALRSVLERESDFLVIGEAGDGEEAVKLASQSMPDVVIMDISMPKLNGIEATKQIKKVCPRTAILVLTVHGESEHIFSILAAGAAGYLTKEVFGPEVIHAVRGLAAGEAVLSAAILDQIRANVKGIENRPFYCREELTHRELEVLKLAAKGISNKDIACKLNLSLHTVKSYLVTIFSKLQVASRTEAVIKSIQASIINIEDLK